MAALLIPFLLTLAGGNMQNKNSGQAQSLFGLAEEQFYNQPSMQLPTRNFTSELVDKDIEGIFIDAPTMVALDKHGKVPLACVRSGPTEKICRQNFSTTSRLVVAHLETGSIQIIKPVVRPRNPHSKPPSPGWVAVTEDLDLAELANLGPKLGRYACVIVCGPETSNQRIITLYPSEKSEGTKDFQQLLIALRAKGGSPLSLVSEKVLELKDEAGLSGVESPVWRITPVNDPAGQRIRLDFWLEIPPRLVFTKEKPRLDEKGNRIHAVLPVSWVGFDEERALVLDRDIGMPVYAAPTGDADRPIVSGSISFPLEKLLSSKTPRKTLYLWAFALDRMALATIERPPN